MLMFSQHLHFYCVEELLLGSRPITMCGIAYNTDISVGSVETSTHEHLMFRKVCARVWWVPKVLTFNQKVQMLLCMLNGRTGLYWM
jgi:hypothetical protein